MTTGCLEELRKSSPLILPERWTVSGHRTYNTDMHDGLVGAVVFSLVPHHHLHDPRGHENSVLSATSRKFRLKVKSGHLPKFYSAAAAAAAAAVCVAL